MFSVQRESLGGVTEVTQTQIYVEGECGELFEGFSFKIPQAENYRPMFQK